MDPSIKKKPEKPRMRRVGSNMWVCWSKEGSFFSTSGHFAYRDWQRTRAALNKHEGK